MKWNRGLWIRIAVPVVAFGFMHLAGWRSCTAILSGTWPAGAKGDFLGIVCGVCYTLSYFATVVVVPIVVIAAGVLALWDARARSRVSPDPTAPTLNRNLCGSSQEGGA